VQAEKIKIMEIEGDGSAEILRKLNNLISTLYQEKETTPKV
jgi:hypothetical protein